VNRNAATKPAAALAGAVAGEINDYLTVVMNSRWIESPCPENLAAVESATRRCRLIARGLTLYAERYGNFGRPVPLRAVLDEDLW
jgi:hypothetical protein